MFLTASAANAFVALKTQTVVIMWKRRRDPNRHGIELHKKLNTRQRGDFIKAVSTGIESTQFIITKQCKI